MNSYPSPQYRQEDQNQAGILDTLGKIALTAGAGVGLLYGLNPKLRQSARQRIADIVNDPKVVENVQKARAASPETKTAAIRSERPRGPQVVDLNQIPDPWSGEMPSPLIRSVQVSEVPNVQSQRLALPGQQERLALPAVIKEDPYVPAASSEPPSWQSAGNMVGDYGQLYGARRNKGTIRAIEQARRQAAADTYVNTIRSNPDSYQLSVPGVNPELIALRSKEGLPSPGELTGIAESRPLSAAPEQGSFALTYNQARGAVAPQADPEKAARIARNQAKDKARVSDYMSDVLESVISETEFTSETIPSDLLKLAERAGTGNIDVQDVNTFKNWAQSTFKNDPVILSEIDQNLSSITFSPKTSTNPVVSQAVEAIDTGADQAAMRVSRTVQRDPGENLTEFDLVQDAYEQRGASPVQAADAAVAATEGNVAFTQTDRPLTESSAARFFANERDEIASQLGEQGLLVTPGRIEKELGNRFGSEAYTYGPKYTQRKQALQLGATYDPKFFENIKTPSVQIAGETVPAGRIPGTKIERTPYTNTLIAEDVELGLRQPTFMKETAERLQEKAADQRDWLGSVRLEEASKNAKLNAELINTNRQYNETLDYSRELTDFLDSKRGTPEQRTRARQRLDDVNYELDRLDVLSEDLNQAVYGGQSGARVRGAEEFTENYIANLTPPPRLKSGVEEGQRIFFEADEFGQPIPGTQELRSERQMVDMKPKGGGGRNVAEFSAGNRDEGVEIDLENILQQTRTPRGQSAREYTKDQFGYRPGTGLTGEALEGQPFTDDRTQTGRVIKRTGIQKSGPQPGSMKAAVNPYTQLDDETLGMISLQGSEADASNAARILARRRREGYDPSTVTGPGQSQRVVSSVALTPEQKQIKINSMDASQQIMALQRSGRPDAQKLVQEYIQKLQGGI